jgi:pimeloyl-ACP methyl ester carboxylesterase
MHVVEDGARGAPAVLLIHGTGASTAWWDPVVPALAGSRRVIRVDLLGHGKSSSPAGGYDIPTQARRVGAALDMLGAERVTVIGHSTGGAVATALAEQRPDRVAALALIDIGPSLDAIIDQGLAGRLLLAPLPGRLLWAFANGSHHSQGHGQRLHPPGRHPWRHHRGNAGDDPPRPCGDQPRIR